MRLSVFGAKDDAAANAAIGASARAEALQS